MITADIIYIAACLVLTAGHYTMWRGGVMEKHRLLNITALLPALATALSLVRADWETCLIPAYLGTMLYTLAFTAESAKKFLPAAVISFLSVIAAAVICLCAHGYRKPVYLEDFNKMFGTMKKYYVLSDHKKTDWDGIYAKYQPQIAALGRDSYEEYYRLCYRFCCEFNDLHIMAYPIESRNPDFTIKGIQNEICGKDPGFTAVRLDDGRVLACCVSEESDAYAAGLRTGSELLSFNGMEINEYIDSAEISYTSFADIDNLEFCRPIMAFGVYDSSAEVGFRGEDGSSVTASVKPSGNYSERIRSAMKLLFGEYEEDNNYSWKDLGGDVASLEINDFMDFPALKDKSKIQRLRDMCENTDIKSPLAYLAMEEIIGQIKDAGKTKLVIDLRGNGGGSLVNAETVIDFFTSEPLYIETEEYTNFTTGKTIHGEPDMTEGNYGTWTGDVVILVSQGTVSAAEIFTNTMKRLPNVTVMGLTDTCGCAMGVSTTTTDLLAYQFPIFRGIDEDGNILIDSGEDMQSRLERDIKLGLGEAAFRAIFIDQKDYAMDEAVRYLGGTPE